MVWKTKYLNTWIWKYWGIFLNAWDHFLWGTGIIQSLLMVWQWVFDGLMANFHTTVCYCFNKSHELNSWVFWRFTNWSWRLLHNYLPGSEVVNFQFKISLGGGYCDVPLGAIFIFPIWLTPFIRECLDYLCSTPQVLYTELKLHTLTFLHLFSLHWLDHRTDGRWRAWYGWVET